MSDCHLHKFRLAASDVSARCRLAVPEISLLAAASRNFDRCTFHALPSSATGGGKGETPFISKQKSTSAKCSPNRDSLSPAGSVRVGSDLPPAGHSLPSALRCPKFLARCRSRNSDRCTFHALPSSATGGGRLSDCHLHKFRIAASEVSARCRLAVPEISCSLPLAKFRPLHVSRLAFFRYRRRTFVGTLFTSISSCGIRCIGSLPPCGARNFFARCRFAKFRPLHVSRPAFFRHRRRQGVKPLSNQNKRALLRSALLFWQPNRDSNPNKQSQSLLCYRYTIRLYLLLAENSISVCPPVVNSFLQFSKNYA